MIYRLKFLPSALKDWEKLDQSIKRQFKKKLVNRLENPHIPSAQPFGYPNHYKIKLRTLGYRLVYEVVDDELVVTVTAAVGGGRGCFAYADSLKY